MSQLRVVFLWSEWGVIGGVNTFLRRCLDHLPRFGVDASVVEVDRRWQPRSLRTAAPVRPDVVTANRGFWQTPHGYHQSVVRAIAARKPHVIVCNEHSGWRYLPTFENVPAVGIIHVDFPDARWWDEVQATAPRMAAFVAVSDHIASKLTARLGPQYQVVSIPSGVAASGGPRALPSGTRPLILFVGRLVEHQKRVNDLVPFVKALSRSLSDFELVVVGDGPEKEALESRLSATEKGKVVFTGAIDPDAVNAYYKRAHFFVQFSAFEGLSIALLEAMGHGVVPIVTAIESGVDQVIQDGCNGHLFPVGQPERAAAAISACLPDWDARSAAAFTTIRDHFSLEQMCEQYAGVFRRVAAGAVTDVPRFKDAGYERFRGRLARRVVPVRIYEEILGCRL